MTDVVAAEFQNILCHYKKNQEHILFDAFNNIQTCNGCHLARTKDVQRKMLRTRLVNNFYLIIFIIFFVFASCGMLILRSLNRGNTFGGGYLSILWPFEECPIAY